MRDITTSKEKLLKKIRKALLEKRDNPYPNLEDLPHYPPTDELLEVAFCRSNLQQYPASLFFARTKCNSLKIY